MALNLGFWFAEGAKGLLYHRLTAMITIVGMALSLWLFGFLYLIMMNLQAYRISLTKGFQLEVFLEPATNFELHQHIREQIAKLDGIIEIEYIDSEKAAEIFAREFGKEIFNILEHNPLPASYKVNLDPKNRSVEYAEELSRQISQFPGVDEVVFQSGLMELLENKFDALSKSLLIFGILILSGTMAVFYQGIKLSLKVRKNFIYTLVLAGANFRTIKLPFIFEGIITGLIAGIGSYAGLLAAHFLLNRFFITLTLPDWLYMLVPAGLIFGLAGAAFSVSKIPKSFLSIK